MILIVECLTSGLTKHRFSYEVLGSGWCYSRYLLGPPRSDEHSELTFNPRMTCGYGYAVHTYCSIEITRPETTRRGPFQYIRN